MPLVAMTREMGSLGKDVAAQLSERLGKKLVHYEMIDQLANKMRLRKSHVVRFLEGKSGIWERLTTDKTSFSIYTADETFRLAESNGIAVIRGWGAAHLLRQVPHVVCVRVCAPFDIRVERMMKRLDTDDRALVETRDQTFGRGARGNHPPALRDRLAAAGKLRPRAEYRALDDRQMRG